jgi:UDP:flavonoid glycosyltransferase YjiC (YdhE family)
MLPRPDQEEAKYMHYVYDVLQELKTFINESGESGFVYVSFGTSIAFETIPTPIFQVFLTAFGNSPFQFIWKWNGTRPSEMPPNVLTASWLPQEAILGSNLTSP